MDTQYQRMQELIAEQKKRYRQLAAVKAKTDLRIKVTRFDIKYRYAAPAEQERITGLLAQLPRTPEQTLDFSALPKAKEVETPAHNGKAWLCFLTGDEAYRGLIVAGSVTDLLADRAEWNKFCPDLLLILGDMKHFIAVSPEGTFTEGRLV